MVPLVLLCAVSVCGLNRTDSLMECPLRLRALLLPHLTSLTSPAPATCHSTHSMLHTPLTQPTFTSALSLSYLPLLEMAGAVQLSSTSSVCVVGCLLV